MVVKRIVSGAQTGADRAALDVALELGIPCGGWVPQGRIDELGRIPDHYPSLVETESADYVERTTANVRDSSGTLIVSHGALTGGSLYTQQAAASLARPCLHLDLDAVSLESASDRLVVWLDTENIEVLNVAGPRESKDPQIYARVATLLRGALGPGR
jgi:hypothetical protein